VPAPALLDLFLGLCAVASPPGEERPVADRVAAYVRGLGLDVAEDDAGTRIGSTAGNLYARLAPTAPGTPIFLCAHLDTVPPEAAIEPVVGDDGIVRNAAGTILGADNKAAVAVMLEATRRVVEERRPHAGIELLFTPKEEVGLLGAGAFDAGRLAASVGYVYDQAAPIGEIILGAPNAHTLEARFHGRAAHAGMYPEDGRSAIVAAARAVADLRLGRVDELTTANVGTIEGGTARNIVPEWCTLRAEARSHDERALADLVREMLETISFAATVSDCTVETRSPSSTAATASARTTCRSGLPRTPSAGPVTSRRRRSRVAPPTPTSSTRAACSASTSPTAWPRSTRPTSTSRSPTSTRWSR
jgi:tripeptide aminopeptidase